jgi:spermidine synthase
MISKGSWLVLLAAAACAATLPDGYYMSFRSIVYDQDLGYPYRIIEGKTGVLSIFHEGHAFELNGTKYTGGAITNAWADIGYAPEILVGRPITRALVIGAGHGDQAMALDSLPSQPTVDVAELSDELVNAQLDETIASRIGASYFRGAYGMRVHVVDGRRWINQALADGIRYDVIQLGITMPSSGTSGNLYTREIFEKMHALLADDGVLMVYSFASALRAGLAVFSNAYFVAGIPNVLAFTGEVFMTKHEISSPVWRDADLQKVADVCNQRGHSFEQASTCPIAITPDAALSLREVPQPFASRFPVNEDDTVIMTFNKIWSRENPGETPPGYRVWLGDVADRADFPTIPISRIR